MEQNPSSSETRLNDIDPDPTVIIPGQDTILEKTPAGEINQTGFDPTQIAASTPAVSNSPTSSDSFRYTEPHSGHGSDAVTNLAIVGPGSVLKNRYDLLEIIGVGGMGTVYKALDRRDIEAGNSAFIAIKVLNDEFKSDPELLKALHSEARKTQSLAHPNILTVYDFDRDNQTVFMTMEYMQGATLDKIIKGHPQGLKKSEILLILKQICSALTYAHNRGIIHSDFKPANVFVDINNRVKVLDFGIARLQNFSRVGSFDAGVLGGVTPAYASLEMLEGAPPDPRDDIYALACVAYELFSGTHPFNRERINNCIKKQLQPKRIPALTNTEWAALKNALRFERANRTGTVELFLQKLENEQKRTKSVLLMLTAGLMLGLSAIGINHFLPLTDNTQEPGKPIARIENVLPKPQDTNLNNAREIPTLPPVSEPGPVIETQAAKESVIPPLPGYALELSLNKKRFKIGDQLILKFTVKEALYVNIAVINSSGEVTVIYPNSYQTNNYNVPGTTYQVPPKGSNATLDIGGPTGTETLVAIASDTPVPVNMADYKNPDKLMQTSRLIFKTLTYRIY